MIVLQEGVLDSLLGDSVEPVNAAMALRQVGAAEPVDGLRLLAELSDRTDALRESDPAIIGGLLRGIHMLALRAEHAMLAELDPSIILDVEQGLPEPCPNRHLLLHLLAVQRSDESLEALVSRLVDDPPGEWIEAAQVLSPLMLRHSTLLTL